MHPRVRKNREVLSLFSPEVFPIAYTTNSRSPQQINYFLSRQPKTEILVYIIVHKKETKMKIPTVFVSIDGGIATIHTNDPNIRVVFQDNDDCDDEETREMYVENEDAYNDLIKAEGVRYADLILANDAK